MLALLSILSALALLGLTVYALHRHQTMEVEITVNRSAPLPPLEPNAAVRLRRQDAPAPSRKPARQKPDTARPAAPAAPKSASTAASWQGEIAQLKAESRFAEAYTLCRRYFPLWGAYNQYCMVLRTELKAAGTDPVKYPQLLESLYRTAVIAELLHDKSTESSKLTNAELRKLDLDAVAELPFPFTEIGYAHLRLIRKGDVKQLVDAWGRPQGHAPPRQFHAEWWQKQFTP